MNIEKIYLEDLIRLIEYKYPERTDLIEQIRLRFGSWTYPGVFTFDGTPQNAPNSETLDLCTEEINDLNLDSDVFISILADGSIRNIKYLSLLPDRSKR